MRNHDQFDQLLDSALRTYAGSDSGLEQRVLARVAAESEPMHAELWWTTLLRWRPLALALSIAICAVLLLVAAPRLFRSPPQHPGQHPNQARHGIAPPQNKRNMEQAIVTNPNPTKLARANATRHPSNGHPARHAMSPESLPKLEQFPAPQPLTPEEKALVALAAQNPKLAASLFANEPVQEPRPLTIAAIKIAPIEMPPPGKN